MTTQLPQSSTPTPSRTNLYEQDFYLWIQTMAELLKQQRFTELDLENLVDEIETMGRSEKRALTSNLEVVLMHLLKYQYQPAKRSNSWRLTLFEHRDRLQQALEDSPSLKPFLQDSFNESYQKARKKAAIETGFDISTFPEKSCFTPEDTLNLDFLPD